MRRLHEGFDEWKSTGGKQRPMPHRPDAADPGTPVDQERQRAALEADTKKAREAANKLLAAADKMERRLPLPAQINVVVGAPPARGVPRKFTMERQRQYLDGIARGAGVNAAAKLAGVTRQTINNYRRSDPDFLEAEKDAYRSLADDAEVSLYQQAMSGNMDAIKILIYGLKPEMWTPVQKMQVHVSGEVAHVNMDSVMEEIDRFHALLQARVISNAAAPAIEAGADDAEIVDED